MITNGCGVVTIGKVCLRNIIKITLFWCDCHSFSCFINTDLSCFWLVLEVLLLLTLIAWLGFVLNDSFDTFSSVLTLLFKLSSISMQRGTAELFCLTVFSRILTVFLVELYSLSGLAILASMLSRNILHLSTISLSRSTALNVGFAQVWQNQLLLVRLLSNFINSLSRLQQWLGK